MAFLVSTTGNYLGVIVFDDLDGRWIQHPVSNLDLSLEFPESQLKSSSSIKQALDNGWITVVDSKGNIINSSAVLDNIFTPHNLTAHEDVSITSPADNSVLVYDAVNNLWVDKTPAEAGLSEVGHTHGHPQLDYGQVNASSLFSTTSSSYTFLSGMELIAPALGDYLLYFQGNFQVTQDNSTVGLVFYVNNSQLTQSELLHFFKKDDKYYNLSLQSIAVNVSSGSVFRLYWKVEQGTLKVFNRYFSFIRLK